VLIVQRFGPLLAGCGVALDAAGGVAGACIVTGHPGDLPFGGP